jgi:hypothetical protein
MPIKKLIKKGVKAVKKKLTAKQKETVSRVDKRIKEAMEKGGRDPKTYSRAISNKNLKSADAIKKKKAKTTKEVRAKNKEAQKKPASQTQKNLRFRKKYDIEAAKDQPFDTKLDTPSVTGRTGVTIQGNKINLGDDVVGFTNFIKMQQSKSGLSISKYREKLNQITRSKEASKAQKDAAQKKLDKMDAKDEADFATTGRKISQSLRGRKKKPDDYKIAQQKLEKNGEMGAEFERLTKNEQDALIRSAKLKQGMKSPKESAKEIVRKRMRMAEGGLKMPTADQTGLRKLPTQVRNKMGYMYGGGMAKKPRMSKMDYRKGGMVMVVLDMMKKKKKGK